jgi:hypothetical protein
MADNTRFEVLKRWFKSIFRAVFVTYFYLTLVGIGLAASLLPVVFPGAAAPPESSSSFVRTVAHIGEAILVAGVVTTFMRFFASLDIVGEKIQGWLTDDRYLEKLAAKTTEQVGGKMEGWLTNERYLEKVANQSALALYEPQQVLNIADLRTVWRNISLAMTRHAFPHIADKVYSKTLDQLVKASEEYYIDYYSRETTLEPVKDNADLVKIRHVLSLTVIANQHNASAKFSARFLLDEFSDKNLEIEYFRADGRNRTVALQKSPGDRAGVDQFLLETEIPPGVSLRIEFCYRLRQSLIQDPFILWTTTRYVRYARHEINFPKGVACTYQDATVASLLELDPQGSNTDPTGLGGKLVYASRPGELIFPGSAFIFMLRKEMSSS